MRLYRSAIVSMRSLDKALGIEHWLPSRGQPISVNVDGAPDMFVASPRSHTNRNAMDKPSALLFL
jgi:hypothetical protein